VAVRWDLVTVTVGGICVSVIVAGMKVDVNVGWTGPGCWWQSLEQVSVKEVED